MIESRQQAFDLAPYAMERARSRESLCLVDCFATVRANNALAGALYLHRPIKDPVRY
jgi:hypothetical protein